MTQRKLRFIPFSLAALSLMAVFSQTALAGPPLICHPFDIGNARSLPWAGSEWRAVKKDYDINRLVADTLALLTDETPVIVRMETIRRATVYSVWALMDRKVAFATRDLNTANELLARLVARAQKTQGGGRAASLAWFDVGYFVESYKQAAGSAPQGLDGYAHVVKAIGMSGGDPEMEFAAALISLFPRRPTHQEHFQRAAARKGEDPLLARNLNKYLSEMGGAAKN